MTTESIAPDRLRTIEDRLLVIETEIRHTATSADVRNGLLVAVGPLYLLVIGALLSTVFFLLPHVKFS